MTECLFITSPAVILHSTQTLIASHQSRSHVFPQQQTHGWMWEHVNLSRQVEPPQHRAAFAASLAQLHQPTKPYDSPTQARKHWQSVHSLSSDSLMLLWYPSVSSVTFRTAGQRASFWGDFELPVWTFPSGWIVILILWFVGYHMKHFFVHIPTFSPGKLAPLPMVKV